jgi:hypothetical protein
MLRCTGKVVRIESKPWTMEGRAGITTTARVLVGEADFSDVKIPDATVKFPAKGDLVDYAVVPGVNNGRLSVTVRGNWSEIISEDTADAYRELHSLSGS